MITPFNCPCLRGVAARAESIHLIFYGPEAKPEGRGQANSTTLCLKDRCTILNQVLTGYRMSTGSPQSIPIRTHSFLKAKTHTNTSRPFCHTAHTRAHLISCVRGVTTHHRNNIRFKPSSTSVQPHGPLNHTGIQCLIKWHGLTFDHLPRPHSHLAGFKDHTASGTCPSIAVARSYAPAFKHWLVKPRPIESNTTCINYAHTVPGTRPHA